MKITVTCIGKLKEAYWREGVLEYQKRFKRYGELEILEFPDEKTKEHASEQEEELIRKKEGKPLRSYLDSQNAYVIALVIKGKRMDSDAFSRMLGNLFSEGYSHVVFLIGGSLGLSGELMRRADLMLSFSDFTFPHQMMRVILSEQLYRAMRILHHEPYHK